MHMKKNHSNKYWMASIVLANFQWMVRLIPVEKRMAAGAGSTTTPVKRHASYDSYFAFFDLI